ncbi:MAG: HAD family phosphatase [Treponema sp.]|nr:HAD family phosphatase [Treponema sp.]
MPYMIADFDGFIFDLDGTLLDSMGIWQRIDRDWFAEKGLRAPANLSGIFRSMTARQAADYVVRRFRVGLSAQEVLAEWERAAVEQYRSGAPLKPGAAALLAALRGAGKKCAIATSCFPAACEAALAAQGLRAFFDAIVYSCEVRTASGSPADKSGPEIWRAAARALGLPPRRCVVFEDLAEALRGARSAGMGFAAVYDPSCPDWPAFAADADYAFFSLEEARYAP